MKYKQAVFKNKKYMAFMAENPSEFDLERARGLCEGNEYLLPFRWNGDKCIAMYDIDVLRPLKAMDEDELERLRHSGTEEALDYLECRVSKGGCVMLEPENIFVEDGQRLRFVEAPFSGGPRGDLEALRDFIMPERKGVEEIFGEFNDDEDKRFDEYGGETDVRPDRNGDDTLLGEDCINDDASPSPTPRTYFSGGPRGDHEALRDNIMPERKSEEDIFGEIDDDEDKRFDEYDGEPDAWLDRNGDDTLLGEDHIYDDVSPSSTPRINSSPNLQGILGGIGPDDTVSFPAGDNGRQTGAIDIVIPRDKPVKSGKSGNKPKKDSGKEKKGGLFGRLFGGRGSAPKNRKPPHKKNGFSDMFNGDSSGDETPAHSMNEALYLSPKKKLTRKAIRVDRDEIFFIGRTSGDLVLNKPTISEEHAVIEYDHGKYYISDTNSKNGTYLNGERLQAHVPNEITDGSELKFHTIVYYAIMKPMEGE